MPLPPRRTSVQAGGGANSNSKEWFGVELIRAGEGINAVIAISFTV